MKVYEYGCDGGSISIGTKSCRVCIPNDIGDGRYILRVYSLRDDARCVEEERNKYKWKGVVEGNRINVYNYDCLSDDELSDDENILCTLRGRYAVYVCRGDIALVKWD